MGFAFAGTGLGLGAWVIARKLLWNYGIMGWPSLFAAVVILGGVQLMATSVIGEYIARIYVQAQARPLYNVAERMNFDSLRAPDELQRPSTTPPARAAALQAPATASGAFESGPERDGTGADRIVKGAAV
jgi:dolichol-phosphate mannosyltransferase